MPVADPPVANVTGMPPRELVEEPVKPPDAATYEPVPAEVRFSAAEETPWVDIASSRPGINPAPEWEPVGNMGKIPPVPSQAPEVPIPQKPVEPIAQAPVVPIPQEPVKFVPQKPVKYVPQKPVEPVSQAPVASIPQEPVESFPAIPAPKRKTGLMIAIAAGMLVAAVGGWVWYAHSHRGVSSATQSSASTPQSTAQGVTSVMPGTTAQPAKPPAGNAEVATAYAPIAAPQPVPTSAPSSASSASKQTPSSNQPGFGNQAVPKPAPSVIRAPAILPPPPQFPPVKARSGVRHYQGPPVPHGGSVVFDNLPKERLRFTFDRAAWELILKTNPDGTKKAILISQAQGSLSSCDLGWELID